ncbi:MAG: 16S rRNA (cytidine(1402)-2'-O)-methyltransferase [Bacteroidetes bacterium]|nr:MAG: 16S rRNA (cytidine(1402)-2'-O)-methyltransferase [Bacteroidota bacterium]
MPEEIRNGTLYVVPTPIGNLGDITFRAVQVLGGVDLIAAEDTRTTKVLLDHYDIRRPLISLFSHNEQFRVPQIIDRLKDGNSVAVVSDAGTPGISDPAHAIITAAIEAGITIVPLPGATAFVPALVASGLPTHSFVFEGFLPHKKGRRTKLDALRSERRTIVLYESPHRILRTLDDLREHLGDRRAAIGRELTKKFEEMLRGTLSELSADLTQRSIKGEFVVVIEGSEDDVRSK